jgi:poly(A) polymerase Pap1
MKYVVVEESVSNHCCFEASVIDTTIEERKPGHIICECFDISQANKLKDLLNNTIYTKEEFFKLEKLCLSLITNVDSSEFYCDTPSGTIEAIVRSLVEKLEHIKEGINK